MRITVYLPDGQEFEVVGSWQGLAEIVGSWGPLGSAEAMTVPTIRVQRAFRVPRGEFIPSGRRYAGNPLSVFKDVATGEVLYNPRAPKAIELLRPDLRRWIDDHPEWPGELVSERTGGDQCQR